MRVARFVSLALLGVLASPGLEARVLSYGPVTDRPGVPAIQKRTNRFFAILEKEVQASGAVCPGCPWLSPNGRLVLHDSSGREEPRVVLPSGGTGEVGLAAVAYQEEPDGSRHLLALTDATLGTDNPTFRWGYLYSGDGGATWRRVPVPFSDYPSFSIEYQLGPDRGGPLARGTGAQILPGGGGTPFFFVHPSGADGRSSLFALRRDATVQEVLRSEADVAWLALVGGDRDGREVLVRTMSVRGSEQGLLGVTGDGVVRSLAANLPLGVQSGWITPRGRVYVQASDSVHLVDGGRALRVAGLTTANGVVFGVPTADHEGAWIAQVGRGVPTVLSRHTPDKGLEVAWTDVTAPEVEALHAGASGRRLLVQVHRPRQATIEQQLFVDPALAIWEVGAPAPRSYDELFLVERLSKGFVHLDVDRVAEGDPFVFDSGDDSPIFMGGPASGGAGGADVVQEWGVVKGSLRQRLLVPAVARAEGAFGSTWRSELLIRNPDATPVAVDLSFVPALPAPGGSAAVEARVSRPAGEDMQFFRTARVTLAPREIRRYADVLAVPFGVSSGSGAVFVTPPLGRSVEVTSRTYATTETGSYGMGVLAVDVFTALSPRFSGTFSAAIAGEGFRTNLVATDVSGRGSEVVLDPLVFGPGAGSRFRMAAPPNGIVQTNDVASVASLRSWQTASLLATPSSGEACVGAIVIDNQSNDPSWFGPDLPAPVARTIPAIVHAGGAGGARFVSDLFLTNPSDDLRTVTLAAKTWTSVGPETLLTFTMLPRESRVVPDVLRTLFGLSGVARLRFQSRDGWGRLDAGGVRATSRTYAIGADGATYGIPIPPLNSFQSASSGDALEILGPVGGPAFRTNLSLVDLSAATWADERVSARVQVFDERGAELDSFDVRVPLAGGLQIDDLFRARGLGDGPEAALIRVSPAGGLVAAYATTIDQGTNDPSYFAARLAAKE